jgi:hypothetical protein
MMLIPVVTAYSADHDDEDVNLDCVSAITTNINNGVGFDIIASAPEGTWGRYNVTVTGV